MFNESTNLSKNRIDWIDTAKGIGILLVVFGHAFTMENSLIKIYIYSFHLPLFFFLSGLLFKYEKYKSYFAFLSSKVKTLIVPYLFFCITSYIVGYIIKLKSGPFDPVIVPTIKSIVFGDGSHLAQLNNVALWFLPCLFITEHIFFFIIKASRQTRNITISLVVLPVVGILFSIYVKKHIPWSANVAIIASTFYGLGYLSYRFKATVDHFVSNKMNGLVSSALFFISFVASLLNGRVDMNSNFYGNPILFYISALAGVAIYIKLSTLIDKVKFINYIGRNSLIIFGTHFLVFQLIANYNLLKFIYNPYFKIQDDVYTNLMLYTIIGIVLTIPLIYVINTFAPFLIGRKRQVIKIQIPVKA